MIAHTQQRGVENGHHTCLNRIYESAEPTTIVGERIKTNIRCSGRQKGRYKCILWIVCVFVVRPRPIKRQSRCSWIDETRILFKKKKKNMCNVRCTIFRTGNSSSLFPCSTRLNKWITSLACRFSYMGVVFVLSSRSGAISSVINMIDGVYQSTPVYRSIFNLVVVLTNLSVFWCRVCLSSRIGRIVHSLDDRC